MDMKTFILILASWPFVMGSCTSETPIPNADHIVLGRIEKISIVDQKGRLVAKEPKFTSDDALIRLAVSTTHVIRTFLGTFPEKFESIYRGATPIDVAAERKTMLGEEYIFIMRGKDLQGMSRLKFAERVTTEKDLLRRLKTQPIE
jgi:hypothetical protein